jgi:hypothetical protein
MRTDGEVRARLTAHKDKFATTLETGNRPYEEERLRARIEECEWFLGANGETCPKCGSARVMYTTKTGALAGVMRWGCMCGNEERVE